jgi:hypothetical protein
MVCVEATLSFSPKLSSSDQGYSGIPIRFLFNINLSSVTKDIQISLLNLHKLQSGSFIVSLNMVAVIGYPGGCRVPIR